MQQLCSRLAVLLSTALLVSASTAAAAAAQQHPLIDVAAIQQGVEAARAEVTAAIADPTKAFTDLYLVRFAAESAPRGHRTPGGPNDSLTKEARLQIFKDNLQTAADRNAAAAAAGQLLAYGITPFMHLTQAEYEREYLGQVADAAVPAPTPATTTTAGTWAAVNTEAVDAYEFADYPDYVLSEPAASRRLLARQEQQLLSGLTSNAVAGGGSADDGTDIVLTQPVASDAAGNATAPHVLPPAQQFPVGGPHAADAAPTPLPDATDAAAAQPPVSLPTLPSLPFNPEPGARGCTAQRDYPYRGVVPPAEGVNWVLAGRTTPVKDQGVCGSCVAMATTALGEFMHMRKFGTSNTTTDLSEQDMLDCTTGDGCLGQFQTAYADMLGCVGVALEHDAPYRVSDNDNSCRPMRRRYSGMSYGSGGGWAFVPPTSNGLAQAVSQAPVLVTLDATQWMLYRGGLLPCTAPGQYTNHAVAVVGYVDQVSLPSGEVADLFIVRNSFGTWWGSGNGPQLSGHILLPKGCGSSEGSKGGSGLGPSGLHAVDGVVPLYG